MFTGIIKSTGKVISYDEKTYVLRIACQTGDEFFLGGSIAINGVCLTVTSLASGTITFDLGPETRELTLLSMLKPGDLVNIEKALSLGDFLDGHLVLGHVDGLIQITSIKAITNGQDFRFVGDKKIGDFIVAKGSIAINGVSLTVNSIIGDEFSVCLVPYTIENTCFKNNRVGDRLHVEVDIIGRYLHHFYERSIKAQKITTDLPDTAPGAC
jgi:riboflavin synthase